MGRGSGGGGGGVVQSLNSPFFPPHIGAEPGRAKRRVQDNLHAHARSEPMKNYLPLSIRVHTCSRQRESVFSFFKRS